VKTGVQSIAKTLKTLDSGFRRNDVKKNRTDFFTPSHFAKGGLGDLKVIFYINYKENGFFSKMVMIRT
jgi:hypothetical protein